MKRNLLQIGLTILLSSSLFGFTYEIKDGWQQVGAIQDIDDLSIFNNAGCVDHVWYYDNNNTADPQWKLHIANGNTYNYCGETLTSLKKGQGFWVKATGECTITIDEPVCPTSNMPAPPDLENGTCDMNSTVATGTSCKDILDSGKSTGNGTYTIDPDGNGVNPAFKVYCDMTNDGGGWTALFESDLITTYVYKKGAYTKWEHSNNLNYYDTYYASNNITDNLFEGNNIENIKILLKNSEKLLYTTWTAGAPFQFLSESDDILLNVSGTSTTSGTTETYEILIDPNKLPLKFTSYIGTYKALYPAIDCENNDDGCPTPSGITENIGSIKFK